MDFKRYLIWFVGHVLAPAFTYVVLEKLTEHIVVAIGGTVALVGLAFLLPSLTTGFASLDAGLELLRSTRRTRLLTTWCHFIRAYKRVLTKYPPALLPAETAASVTSQLDVFSVALRRLRGRNAQRFATAYDLVRSLEIDPEHFQGWCLADCTLFMTDLRDALSQISSHPFRGVIQYFDIEQPQVRWLNQLSVIERYLDGEIQTYLGQWPGLQRIQIDDTLRTRVLALLSLDVVYRQGGVQILLARAFLDEHRQEVQDLVRLLRYDAVVTALQFFLEGGNVVRASGSSEKPTPDETRRLPISSYKS